MSNFRELRVWQRAHRLTLAVYKTTAAFPREELYSLTSQTRRACVSISANVAEGCGRRGDAELRRYLRIALGSASELEYLLLLSRDLGYVDGVTYQQINDELTEVGRMLSVLIERVRHVGD